METFTRFASYIAQLLFKMGKVSGKSYTYKTHFILIFFFENRAV